MVVELSLLRIVESCILDFELLVRRGNSVSLLETLSEQQINGNTPNLLVVSLIPAPQLFKIIIIKHYNNKYNNN